MVSGGSSLSWSATWLATTVTVHSSPSTKSLSGLSVKLVGPPLTVAVCAPLVAQAIVNQLPVAFTGSLKVMSIFASSATPVALLAGVVLATVGALSVGTNDPLITISSTPTHSSLLAALVVITRTCTSD